jgi:hypothetical protein
VVINLAELCWRPAMKKNAGAVNSCPPSWRAHRQRLDSRSESRRRGGKQSHAAQGRTAAVVGVHIGSTAVNMVRWPEFIHGGDTCVTLSVIQPSRAQIATAMARITAAGHRR